MNYKCVYCNRFNECENKFTVIDPMQCIDYPDKGKHVGDIQVVKEVENNDIHLSEGYYSIYVKPDLANLEIRIRADDQQESGYIEELPLSDKPAEDYVITYGKTGDTNPWTDIYGAECEIVDPETQQREKYIKFSIIVTEPVDFKARYIPNNLWFGTDHAIREYSWDKEISANPENICMCPHCTSFVLYSTIEKINDDYRCMICKGE